MDAGEARRAFWQIHLGTRAERAVHDAFVGDPTAFRTAEDAASAAGIPLSDIETAFQRFVDSGIIQATAAGYRWREGMRYVLERKDPDAKVVDPVCGMPVAIGAPLHAHDVFGRIEFFCSERCLASFVVWPIAFTRPRGADDGVAFDDDPVQVGSVPGTHAGRATDATPLKGV